MLFNAVVSIIKVVGLDIGDHPLIQSDDEQNEE